MIAGVRVEPLFQRARCKRKDWRRAAIRPLRNPSRRSTVPYECFDFPDDFLLKGGLEPPFSASREVAGTVPVGHRPIVRKPLDTAPPVPEIYALARFAAVRAGLVPGSDTGSEFCPPSAWSNCNKGRDALWGPLGTDSLPLPHFNGALGDRPRRIGLGETNGGQFT